MTDLVAPAGPERERLMASTAPVTDEPLMTSKQMIGYVNDELGIPLSQSVLEKMLAKGHRLSSKAPPVAARYGRRLLFARSQIRPWALSLLTWENPPTHGDMQPTA